MLGGAIFISAAQGTFTNKIISSLSSLAPNLDPYQVIGIGATELRTHYSGQDLTAVLDAYMYGLKQTFIIGIVTACLGFVVAFAPRWESLKGKINVGGAA